ncbi:MAG: hypothetical protein GEU75_15400 [Dehalococcoidia bacterium]|nr:hypothetical protein [Dehalococcoidia bacterium]
MVATLIYPFDLDIEGPDSLDLLAEELPEQLSPGIDCLSSVSSASTTIGSSCGGSFSSIGSVINCG